MTVTKTQLTQRMKERETEIARQSFAKPLKTTIKTRENIHKNIIRF